SAEVDEPAEGRAQSTGVHGVQRSWTESAEVDGPAEGRAQSTGVHGVQRSWTESAEVDEPAEGRAQSTGVHGVQRSWTESAEVDEPAEGRAQSTVSVACGKSITAPLDPALPWRQCETTRAAPRPRRTPAARAAGGSRGRARCC